MTEHILLVEPKYYSQFPPIGLLKLSSLEKSKGNSTELVKKNESPEKEPDKIYVTSLFTWAWNEVWRSIGYYKSQFPEAEIFLGGLYASLLPDHAKLSGVNNIITGLNSEAEEMMPDYGLVPKWDGSIIFASRGCINKCLYCAVPKLEGKICLEKKSILKYVYPKHTIIYFFDNNILAMKYWREIFKELIDLDKEVDFNQGIEARLITAEVVKYITKMKISYIRLAYDKPEERKYVEKAIKLLGENGVDKRNIFVYTLFNFNESPDDFFFRVREIINWGATCYPMRFQPIYALDKDAYISPKWNFKLLERVAAARRIFGYGGAFPPYEGLVEKLNISKGFLDGFSLYPVEKDEKVKIQFDKIIF
jgi:hypothetical protein